MLIDILEEGKERTYVYETADERDAFVEGIEYVNDGSIEVTETGQVRNIHAYNGKFFARLYDADIREDADE